MQAISGSSPSQAAMGRKDPLSNQVSTRNCQIHRFKKKTLTHRLDGCFFNKIGFFATSESETGHLMFKS